MYESYCASCTYLNDNLFCEKKGEYISGNDPKCYNYCEAYSRSNSARENLYGRSGSSGCYITTMMCNLLGYPDNNYYLNTLRNFRDNVMKKDPNYIPLLIKYDVIGPQIAYSLAKDKQGKEIATAMFTRFITQAVSAIEAEKNDMAINTYMAMTNALAETYGIEVIQADLDNYQVDMETLGKARRRVPNENNI